MTYSYADYKEADEMNIDEAVSILEEYKNIVRESSDYHGQKSYVGDAEDYTNFVMYVALGRVITCVKMLDRYSLTRKAQDI